ncbi:unnamed protein product [Didymodactylos carnosus]|uniref:Uncharacterized protein n=1 Tax=Didymodactylos carnosus TaxID=1234261 RepID=A0A814R9F0_9BILA|nr:unnamed protein product [Didymodactylos carnosus]CAF1222957.1 unnamed protein product [Didymodactylos carnosus]CAF3893730.1 unnamed protein product [Didymodactylos carnosus]CAF4031166.1 unnamed protein product [Didymodactylos carnosus]
MRMNQRTEICWSPNISNDLAEIGAEIIIHVFDKPTKKCTSNRRLNFTYPVQEKNSIKCAAWWPSTEYPYTFALGQTNGRIIFENVKDHHHPLCHRTIDSKQGRACSALSWNTDSPYLLLSGFERNRTDNCVVLWDVQTSKQSISTTNQPPTRISQQNPNDVEYKRLDNTNPVKALFETGMGEACSSLTWIRPETRFFAACTAFGRLIKLYDPRGILILLSLYLPRDHS